MKKNEPKINRRNFIRDIMRGGILSSLLAMSGYFLIRERNENDSACNFDFICQNCKKNKHCTLPEASGFRMKKRHTHG